MSIRYNHGRNTAWRRFVHQVQKALPKGLRLGVWERAGMEVMRRKGYDRETPMFKAIELETRTREFRREQKEYE